MSAAAAIEPGLVEEMTGWRRDFHRHPELGFELRRTAGRVAALLERFGIETHRGVGGTGVVGVLKRGDGPRRIGLRADMDALPIAERTGAPHASIHDGVAHACGHDGHMAILLGAAAALSARRDLDGTVVFIFQPSEETGAGAPAMLADGLFERFDVEEIYGLHNMPGLATGHVATRVGPITASESLFEIAIEAQGGHAALPHMGVDAITVGAEIVSALQTIVSRRLDPAENGVVSVTEFETDGRRNVLPGRATLRGDARALSPETTAAIDAHLRRIVEGVASAHGVKATVAYETVFPVCLNAAEPAAAAVAAATALFGVDAVTPAAPPKLFSEDFAHLAAARPGCFLLLGNGVEGAHGRALHSADYEFNDAALAPGAALWVGLVERRLAR